MRAGACDVCMQPADGAGVSVCSVCSVRVHKVGAAAGGALCAELVLTCRVQACYAFGHDSGSGWKCCFCAALPPMSKWAPVPCSLCHMKRGAMLPFQFKPAAGKPGSGWAHASCALLLPGVTLRWVWVPLAPLESTPSHSTTLPHSSGASWGSPAGPEGVRCSECRSKRGSCVVCCHPGCRVPAHPRCALSGGWSCNVLVRAAEKILGWTIGQNEEVALTRPVLCRKDGLSALTTRTPPAPLAGRRKEPLQPQGWARSARRALRTAAAQPRWRQQRLTSGRCSTALQHCPVSSPCLPGPRICCRQARRTRRHAQSEREQ